MSGLGGQTSLVKTPVKKLRAPVRSGFGSFGTKVFRKSEPFPVGLGNKDPHHQYDTFMLRRSSALFCSAKSSSSPPEAKVPNFYIGIQHGAMLAISGFIHYRLSRSLWGIVFGVALGAVLLISSVHDLNSWKKGDSAPAAMLSTAACVSLLYSREVSLMIKKPTTNGYLAAFLSGMILLVYICRTLLTLWKTKREQRLGDVKKD